MLDRIFRFPNAVIPNLLALTVTLGGYVLGVFLLTSSSWVLFLFGVVLTCLSLTWSAYYIHEFSHYAIFKNPIVNRRWGIVMTWINGSCIAHFDDLRRKHLRHHVERADVITFDVQAYLRAAPHWLRNSVLGLEWLYFPAVEFLMRGFVIARAWKQGGRERWRVVTIIALRMSAMLGLYFIAPLAVLGYFMAYLVFITLLRFADCFQHTYDVYPIDGDNPVPKDKVRDREYEQNNTYSDIVGLHHPWLNLIWLNFGYHNAHHEKPAMPWHQLPALHRELFPENFAQVITVPQLLHSFHQHRVDRILAKDYGEVLTIDKANRANNFIGAVGVSFLTAV